MVDAADDSDDGDPYFDSLETLRHYHHRLFAPGSSLSHVGQSKWLPLF